MTEKFKVRVIKIDEHQPGDQGFTIGKVYEASGLVDHIMAIDVVDDTGDISALFEGEWERVDAE
jgi:hypothetical protein